MSTQNAPERLFNFLNLRAVLVKSVGTNFSPSPGLQLQGIPDTLGTPGWPRAGMLQWFRAGQSRSAWQPRWCRPVCDRATQVSLEDVSRHSAPYVGKFDTTQTGLHWSHDISSSRRAVLGPQPDPRASLAPCNTRYCFSLSGAQLIHGIWKTTHR